MEKIVIAVFQEYLVITMSATNCVFFLSGIETFMNMSMPKK